MAISQDLFNPCPWMFRPRIRLMGHPRPQFRVKADLPVGFPYRFNSSVLLYFCHLYSSFKVIPGEAGFRTDFFQIWNNNEEWVLIIFGPLKTPPRSSKSCGCETFRVLKYLLSIFLHYTHHCRMILSKKKCCLLLNGVSTESQKRTSVLQIRRDFSPTRHMTRINVGLALSLVKLLLSSWKIYMCNLVTWYTNK